MNANCSPTLVTMGALASIPMGAIHVSVSTAGRGRAVVRILTTVRQRSAFMALPVMIEWPPSIAHALWARQVIWLLPCIFSFSSAILGQNFWRMGIML